MIHVHPAVSFCHVRCDANKAADLLANVGVKGEVAHQWGPLESFEANEWDHHCRQLVVQDLAGGTQLARPIDVVDVGDRRCEHTMTGQHQDA